MAAPLPYIVARGRKGGSTDRGRHHPRAPAALDDGGARRETRAVHRGRHRRRRLRRPERARGQRRRPRRRSSSAASATSPSSRSSAASASSSRTSSARRSTASPRSPTSTTWCVLASGDPLFFGVGALVAKKVGGEHVEFLPAPSSVQLGLRPRRAQVGRRDGHLAARPRARGPRWRACAAPARWPSSPTTRARRAGSRRTWPRTATAPGAPPCARTSAAPASACAASPSTSWPPATTSRRSTCCCSSATAPGARRRRFSFLHEDDFAKRMPKKGLITKREARLVSLAMLQLRADSVVWDIGAGSGLGVDRSGAPRLRTAASSPSRSTPRASRSAATTCAPSAPTTCASSPAARPRRSPSCPTPTPSSSAAARGRWPRSSRSRSHALRRRRAPRRQRHHARQRQRSLRRPARQRTRNPRSSCSTSRAPSRSRATCAGKRRTRSTSSR